VGAYALYQGRAQGALKKVRPAGAPMVNGQLSLIVGVGEFLFSSVRHCVYSDPPTLKEKYGADGYSLL
jgi:hypothetical protein